MLFRRAIQLSVSSEHWAEITYGPARKGEGCQSAEITGDAESTIQRRSTNRRVCRSRGQVDRRIRCPVMQDHCIWKQCTRHPQFGWQEVGTREPGVPSRAPAQLRIRRPLHVKCLFNKPLTLLRTFRLAHCGELRFAPARVDGITLLNRQQTSSAKLQTHHCFR